MDRILELKQRSTQARARSPSPSDKQGRKRSRTVSMEDVRNMRVLPSSFAPSDLSQCSNPEVTFGLGDGEDESPSRLHLELESESHVFEAGESVIGHALLQLETQLRLKSVHVVLQGNGQTSASLKVGVRRRPTICTAHEEYYRKELQLLGSRDGYVLLKPGVHVLPFVFALPDRLPTSLDATMGSVSYKITARVDPDGCAGGVGPHNTTVLPFIVTARSDLNSLPSARQSVALRDTKQLLFPRRGKVKVDARLDRQGLSPGDIVPLRGEVSLRGPAARVRVSLRQNVRYTLREDNGAEQHSVTKDEVASVEYPRELLDSQLELSTLRMRVPVLPPSTLPCHGAHLIHIGYELRLKVENTRGETLLKLSSPLILGTVPHHMRAQLADHLYRGADAERNLDLPLLDTTACTSGRSTPLSFSPARSPDICSPKNVGVCGPAGYFPSTDVDDPMCL